MNKPPDRVSGAHADAGECHRSCLACQARQEIGPARENGWPAMTKCGDSRMMNVVSTDKVPATERFAFWRGVSSKAWMPKDARCEAHPAARFRAQVAIGEMGPVQWTLLTTTPRSSLPLPPRDLHDLTSVRMPGDRGIGALSSRILPQLARHLPKLSDAETSRLSTLTLDVLTLALADALGTEGLVPPHARQRALTARIHAFIHDNLGDPRLTPGTIAAAHHISRSHLHRLFRRQGRTVAGHIRERRLERCRRDHAPEPGLRLLRALHTDAHHGRASYGGAQRPRRRADSGHVRTAGRPRSAPAPSRRAEPRRGARLREPVPAATP
ncbi:hypothetical protein HCN51_27190 [Nonomuraea sp. FMUSA5-5]|uniref:HTH araC/xylS-type domain-containing protein n=1 Tax=Nonomuraea composti TaxID=2720023 RepID=A0ABX1BBD9_9ACTN|nr:hypothetical protein [Nonomuraea sp. FMUSA5-5]NJP93091.1 hypothetical protein [Nonomuraea sp. FMUSA5-5]